MADHSKPTLTSTYSNFVTEVDGRFDDLALGLDPANTTATNVPTNAIRWTSASSKWQKWNGSSWGDLSSSYAININGTVGATTPSTGAFTTLSASGNVTLSGGTANGVAYLNGSKVVTTGSALTFNGTNLGIGTSSPGELLSLNATRPYIHFTSPTTGQTSSDGCFLGFRTTDGQFEIRNKEASDIVFLTNETERMRIGSSGNVGIGTSSPVAKLQTLIGGTAVTNGADVPSGVFVEGPESASGILQVVVNDAQAAGNGGSIAFGAKHSGNNFAYMGLIKSGKDNSTSGNFAGYLSFSTRPSGGSLTERLRIDSSGNLGLGVTPSAWSVASSRRAIQLGYAGGGALYTSGAGSTLTSLVHGAYNDGTNWLYGANSIAAGRYEVTGASGGSTHAWYTAPSGTAGNAISFTQAMTLNASGNLGIGTSSPAAKTQVSLGSGAIAATTISKANTYLGLGATEYNSNSYRLIGLGYSGSTETQYPAYIGYQETSTSGSTRGDLIFCTRSVTTDTAPTERLRIDSSGNLLVGTTSSNANAGGLQLYNAGGNRGRIDFSNVSGASNVACGFYYGATPTSVGSITTTSTATTYATSSDYRLKENIQPMTGALAKVAALKPVIYKWKADGSDGEGFIAHELAEVVPQCVTGEKDAVDAEGKPVYQGIDTSFLAGLYAAALQELMAEVNSLKAEIQTLKGN